MPADTMKAGRSADQNTADFIASILRLRSDALLEYLRREAKRGNGRQSVYSIASALGIRPLDVSAALGMLCFRGKVKIWCDDDDDARRAEFRFKLDVF